MGFELKLKNNFSTYFYVTKFLIQEQELPKTNVARFRRAGPVCTPFILNSAAMEKLLKYKFCIVRLKFNIRTLFS